MVRRYDMTILRRRTRDNEFSELVDRALVGPESFHVSSVAMRQARDFPERYPFGSDLLQWLAAIEHRVVEPSPRP